MCMFQKVHKFHVCFLNDCLLYEQHIYVGKQGDQPSGMKNKCDMELSQSDGEEWSDSDSIKAHKNG